MANPQRRWQIQNDASGNFLLIDDTIPAIRFQMDVNGKVSNISSIAQDLLLSKNNPVLTVEELSPNTYYPRLNLTNPQRRWQIQNDASGNFLVIDDTAPAVRFQIDANGKISQIASLAQDLLPDADLSHTLGSSALRWKLNGWNPDAHASRHEAGGADPIHNLEYLNVQGSTIIDSSRRLQNIASIIQDLYLGKNYPIFTIEDTATGAWFPVFHLKNPQRDWVIQGGADGAFYIYDNTAAATRLFIDTGGNVKAPTSLLSPNVLPYGGDNTGNVGTDTQRWSLIRGVTITSGDYCLENGFKITEAEKLGLGKGLAFLNKKGKPVMLLDDEGNIHIAGKIKSWGKQNERENT